MLYQKWRNKQRWQSPKRQKGEKQEKLQNNGEGSCQNNSYPANLDNSLSLFENGKLQKRERRRNHR